eukprot:snap_masked-scaffold_79-processed-gene-0.25-mRNA-1 protein AED:1.00 eAED:1.00 QI:0/0/0/0/1/1/2/0/84
MEMLFSRWLIKRYLIQQQAVVVNEFYTARDIIEKNKTSYSQVKKDWKQRNILPLYSVSPHYYIPYKTTTTVMISQQVVIGLPNI